MQLVIAKYPRKQTLGTSRNASAAALSVPYEADSRAG